MILALFVLAVIGMTIILVNGSIFDDDHLGWRSWFKKKLGKYGDLLECRVCAGWWAGLMMGLALFSWWNPLIFLPAAFAGSGIMTIYIILEDFIMSKTDYALGDADEPEQPSNEETTA
jgi:hypothetical protein